MDRLFALRLVAFAVLAGAAGLGAVAMTRSEEAVPAAAYKPAPFVAAPKAVAPVAVPAPAPTSAPAPAPSPTPEPYVVKRVMTLPGPLTHGRHYWDEAGVPDGPIVITVDLAAQVLSVFRGGYEIGTAVILYGATDKPTPLGVFTVTQKDADHVSNLYGAPMPYMLRLTNDGISIHGSNVMRDAATHGCVGVPTAFAKKLFGVVKRGDRVIVTNGERLKLGEAVKAA
jgi:lipoprotein-anchoring transpeptidase ErfK/SrfK